MTMSYQADTGYDLVVQKGLDGARVHLHYTDGGRTITEEYATTNEGRQTINDYKKNALSVKEFFLPLPVRMLPKEPFSTIGLILRLIFICFALLLIGFYISEATFTQRGATSTTQGLVTLTDSYRNDDNSQSCLLHIQFTTAQGQTVDFTPSGVGDSAQYCSYKVGENVSVTYDIHNPHNAQLIQPNNTWLSNLPVLGVGVVIILGVALSFKKYKVVNPAPLVDTEDDDDEEDSED